MTIRREAALLRESLASIFSQTVTSVATVLVVAAMCATVLVTSGRSAGAEQQVLGSIDSYGTRSIVVRAQPSAGLSTSVLARIERLSGVSWAAAFGKATDVTNRAFVGGNPVGIRTVVSSDYGPLGVDARLTGPGRAFVSPSAATALGLRDGVGGVVSDSGTTYSIVGQLKSPSYLSFLSPLVVVPTTANAPPANVSVLVVIAQRADLVVPLAKAVTSQLDIADPSKVSITTSAQLAALRGAVQDQLTGSGRALVFGVLAIAALLVAGILYGLVLLRRKDFGRRRALGASQRLVIRLLIEQTLILAIAGAVLGCTIGWMTLLLSAQPEPAWDYFAAIGVLGCAVSAAASVPPAVIASRRDPLRELRVP